MRFDNKILTHTGNYVDLLNPDHDTISIFDIAWGLANESRFAGQTTQPYSVALHSIVVSHLVAPEFAREALLHDATEGLIKDIPSPLKALLHDYKAMEKRLDSVIRRKWGLPAVMSLEVKQADLYALAIEAHVLMHQHAKDWPLVQKYFPKGVQPPWDVVAAITRQRSQENIFTKFLERAKEIGVEV